MDPPPEPGPSTSRPIASTSTSTTAPMTMRDGVTPKSATDPDSSLSSILLRPSNVPPSALSGSRDLLTLFNLSPLYDTYLRPFLPDPTTHTTELDSPRNQGKGKGKEGEGTTTTTTAATRIGLSFGGIKLNLDPTTPSTGAAGGGGVKKKAKQEKTYSHLVADIPGRNAIRKDTFLQHLVLNPDSPSVDLRALDEDVLRGAFTLKPGTIPGFDALVWENDTEVQGGPVMKKKKKKRPRESEALAGTGSNSASNGPTPSAGGGAQQNGSNVVVDDEHRKKKKLKQA